MPLARDQASELRVEQQKRKDLQGEVASLNLQLSRVGSQADDRAALGHEVQVLKQELASTAQQLHDALRGAESMTSLEQQLAKQTDEFETRLAQMEAQYESRIQSNTRSMLKAQDASDAADAELCQCRDQLQRYMPTFRGELMTCSCRARRTIEDLQYGSQTQTTESQITQMRREMLEAQTQLRRTRAQVEELQKGEELAKQVFDQTMTTLDAERDAHAREVRELQQLISQLGGEISRSVSSVKTIPF